MSSKNMGANARLAGKVALVTGASKGIGRQLAFGLAAAGARVAINYNTDPAGAEAACKEIRDLGGDVRAFQSNIGSKAAVDGLVKSVADAFGSLDILVNNAARTRFGPVFNVTEEDYEDIFNTNVRGAYFGSIAAAREMMKQGGGSIINISSCVTALVVASHGTYAMSKAAVEGMTRQLAIELAPKVRMNAIAPAPTSTERNKQYDPDYDSKWATAIPAGRVAYTRDYVGPCVFLASDESAFMTGQILHVDGGWSLLGHTPDLKDQDFSRDYKLG